MKVSKTKAQMEMARKCLSMRDLSQQTGLTESALRRIFRGENARPVNLGKIARALGVDPETILDEQS